MAKKRTIETLKPNPKNPRVTTDLKVENLSKAMVELGDVSGIVFNRRSRQLVGGHQRSKVIPPGAEVVIEKLFKTPTRAGTVATGYVLYRGERFNYREVDWDESKELAGNLAANKGAGEFDERLVSDMLRDLDDFGFDLDVTLFDETERAELLVPNMNANFEEVEADKTNLGKEKNYPTCPSCGDTIKVFGYK